MRIDDTDPDELDDGEREGHRRGWLIGGAVLVVVGVAAAFLIVRNRDDGEAAPTTTVDGGSETTVPDTLPDEPVGPPPDNAFPDFGSDYMGPELDMLYQRVTDTGIRLTLQNSGDWNDFRGGGDVIIEPMPVPGVAVPESTAFAVEGIRAPVDPFPPDTIAGGVDGWVAPAWCNPVGGLRVTMTFKDAIGVANGQRYGAPREGGMSLTMFSSGHAEGVPFRVLTMQLDPEITLATVTWADGSTDGGAPLNGWLAVATPGDATVAFDVALQRGDEIEVVEYADLPRDGDLGWQKGCNPPPPELPPPGEQPDDPAEAEQAVRDVFDLLWNRDIPMEDKVVLDDTTGVADAAQAVDNGSLGNIAATAEHFLTAIVFTSPDEAWFMYDIKTSASNFTNRFGIAYRIDGVWVISRRVICQDLSLAGVQCVPFSDPIIPPAAG